MPGISAFPRLPVLVDSFQREKVEPAVRAGLAEIIAE
jgi:hypothetical protein